MRVYWMSELITIMKEYRMNSSSVMNCSGHQGEKNWGKEGKIQSAKWTLSSTDHSKASALPPKTGRQEEDCPQSDYWVGIAINRGSSAALVRPPV